MRGFFSGRGIPVGFQRSLPSRERRVKGPPKIWPLPPLWAQGLAVNQFAELTGTAGITTNYSNSGFCLHPPSGKIIKPWTGGHGVGLDNRIDAFSLLQAAPSFSTLIAASASTTADAAYGPDGRPQARHTYWCLVWSPEANRILCLGFRFTYNSGNDLYTVDGFNPDNNQEDPEGTWPSITPTTGFSVACRNGATGDIYCGGAGNDTGGSVYKWAQPSGAWSRPTTTQGISGPMCWDSRRNRFFFLCFGNGTGGGDGLIHHCTLNSTGTTVTAVTFAAGDGTYAAFKTAGENSGTPSLAFQECGMVYDEANDVFLWYEGGFQGGAGERGKIRRIIPNDGVTNWGMDVLSTTGYQPATTQGIEAFTYVPNIGGSLVSVVVGHPKNDQSVFALRTS